MNQSPQPNEFELWHQCRELLESVPANKLETLSIDEKRRAAILSKWVIEKLLTALLIAQKKPASRCDNIATLYRNAGAKLAPEQEALLLSIVPKISSCESDDSGMESDYETTYRLAMTLKEYVHNCITLWSLPKTPEPVAGADPLNVTVEKAAFLEVGRVFNRVFKPGAANVILTLGNGRLRIEFFGGGSELLCETPEKLVAELTAKSFAAIINAHRAEKSPSGKLTLTFRREFGEFATPLAGGRAKFL
jgi:hypothetical protein